MDRVLSLGFDVGMATGPVLGYINQYRLIQLNKKVGSFSIDICGILIFANVLRLNFYLFKKFETALVVQSLLMISMQIILLHLCSRYHPARIQIDMACQTNEQLEQINEGHHKEPESFWRWENFATYALTISLLISISFGVACFCKYVLEFKFYGEIIGLVALVSESVLIVPQIIKNIRMGTTRGLSTLLMVLNLIGDIVKSIYFVLKQQPFQFILCGAVQVSLDIFVSGQIIYYRSKEHRDKEDKSKSLTPISRWQKYLEEQIVDQNHSMLKNGVPARELQEINQSSKQPSQLSTVRRARNSGHSLEDDLNSEQFQENNQIEINDPNAEEVDQPESEEVDEPNNAMQAEHPSKPKQDSDQEGQSYEP